MKKKSVPQPVRLSLSKNDIFLKTSPLCNFIAIFWNLKVCSVNKCMPRIFILPSLVLSAQFVSSNFQYTKTIILFLPSLLHWCRRPNPLDYSTQGSIHGCELDVNPTWGNTSVIPVAITEILAACTGVDVFVQFGCTKPHIK